MITPIFRVQQDDDYIIVIVKIPSAKLSEAEVEFDEHELFFYAPPYFLRLSFEKNSKLAIDGKEKISYDADTTSIIIKLPKLMPGQDFQDLDMLTKLLVTPNRPQENAERAKIEVVSSETFANDDDDDSEDEDQSWQHKHEQKLWTEEEEEKTRLESQPYGFGNLSSGLLARFSREDISFVVDIKDPDKKSPAQRRHARETDEMQHFSENHYLFDQYENVDQIEVLLKYQTCYNLVFLNTFKKSVGPCDSAANEDLQNEFNGLSISKSNCTRNIETIFEVNKIVKDDDKSECKTTCKMIKSGLVDSSDNEDSGALSSTRLTVPLVSNHQNRYQDQCQDEKTRSDCGASDDREKKIILTDNDVFRLKNFTYREYLLDKLQRKRALLELVDIIFAYCYDLRTNEGEYNVESGWTITKLSCTLCWFDRFDSIEETLIACVRRSLIYPLYRNWKLSMKVLQDVHEIFSIGRTALLKCLLEIYGILANSNGDYRYILNDLYITDLCIWIQQVKPETIESLAITIRKCDIDKASVDLGLCELEEAADYVLLHPDEEYNNE